MALLSCRDTVKILSTEDLPVARRRLAVLWHLLICHHCRKYFRQLELIGNFARRVVLNQKLDPENGKKLEDRILEKILK